MFGRTTVRNQTAPPPAVGRLPAYDGCEDQLDSEEAALRQHESRRRGPAARVIVAVSLVCSGFGGGCGGDARDGVAPGGATVLTAADSVRLVAVGGAAAGRLAGGLIGPLTAAIEAGGPAGAIDFCAREALALTTAIQDSIRDGVALRRTTLRPRNEANAPDELDRQVLEELHARAAHGDTLPHYVLRAAGDSLRFYRPLRMQALCLRCHGPVEQLDPEVRAILADRYPMDQATGYGEGDLRGVIRVSVPVSEPRP